jgi:general stress protein 26
MTEETMVGKFTLTQINAFLENPLLARLSTAVPVRTDPGFSQPHTVPVWYLWDGTSLWISAFQSTRKVKEVKRNAYIAVLVDVEKAIDGITAVLMEGRSDLILESATVQQMSQEIYTHYMGEEGVKDDAPQSWIVDPENSIIRLTPQKIFSW